VEGARRPPQRRRPRRLPPLSPNHMCSLPRTRLLATHRRRRRLAWVAAAAVAEAVAAARPASAGRFPAGGRRASVAAAVRHGGGGRCLPFVLRLRTLPIFRLVFFVSQVQGVFANALSSLDLSICVHHYTLRAPCPKGQGNKCPQRHPRPPLSKYHRRYSVPHHRRAP